LKQLLTDGEVMFRETILFLFAFAVPISFCEGINIYVPDYYPTIQEAINAAYDGDTVIVRPGTYLENIDYRGKAIIVKSEVGPDTTVIDGNKTGSVVTFKKGESRDSVLEGFKLTNGSGTNGQWDETYGGGIYCNEASPSIINNIIVGNRVQSDIGIHGGGGGIYCYNYSSPLIEKNTIEQNTGGQSINGGGIYCESFSSPTIKNNTISENTASAGGGIYCYISNPRISGNTISYNTAFGGGIACYDCSPTITSNIITGNMASSAAAISCYHCYSQIKYNIIVYNIANDCAGGIHIDSSAPTIQNNTIYGNSAGNNGGGIYRYTGDPIISNTILWGNSAASGKEIFLFSGDMDVAYCDVRGGWSGTGNIDSDPLFIDPVNGDFHLQVNSPCIDAGDPNLPLDPDGTRADIGALYYEHRQNADLIITKFNFDPTTVDPDQQIIISFTVENTGNVPCGSTCLIGFYLSDDNVVGLDDIYLDQDTIPDLYPGQSYSNSMQILVGDNPGIWYIGGYVDFLDDVTELLESNNDYTSGKIHINSLVRDVDILSKSGGGVVNFNLGPGVSYQRRQYFMLGSMTGTYPGVVLPGGSILPLNMDPFFNYVLDYFNYSNLTNFRGWFDHNGKATAILDTQGSSVPLSVGTILNFAFTTEDPYDFQSNPVEIEIVP